MQTEVVMPTPTRARRAANAFHEGILEHEPRLRRYARALCRTRDLSQVDDLVQDAMTRALAKEHLWQPGTDLRAWLFTILHNCYVNDVRSAARAKFVSLENLNPARAVQSSDGSSTMVQRSAIPERGVIAANQLSAVSLAELRVALTKLPPEMQQAILLVGLEGLTYFEAAEVLGVPVGTVRSRLSRGRDQLMLMMAGDIGKEPDQLEIGDVI